MSPAPRLKALCLTHPAWAGESYLTSFRQTHDLISLSIPDRKAWLTHAAPIIAQHGPFTALIIRMGTLPYEPFDATFFTPLLPSLRLVVSASAGYNEFDVPWLTGHGIAFCNTRNAVSEATADMAVFLVLACVRDTSRGERAAREGRWRADLVPARDPAGMVLGILGMGGIGRAVARKVRVFGMEVVYYSRRRCGVGVEEECGARYCGSLEELLGVSDVVSLSVPLNEETTGMIGEREIGLMKDGAILINTARGAVVDEEALIRGLESGKIWRAGLDVYPNEPDINPYFRTSDKVVLQPHLGGLTEVSFRKAERECLDNVREYFETGRPPSGAVVNQVATTQ